MARRETVRARLDEIEDAISLMLIQIEALRLLFSLLLDFDLVRIEEGLEEPHLLAFEDALAEMLEQADPDSEDPTEVVRAAAIASALRLVDRGPPAGGGGDRPANDG